MYQNNSKFFSKKYSIFNGTKAITSIDGLF